MSGGSSRNPNSLANLRPNKKGRPPRNYSVSHMLSIYADEQAETIDDQGRTLTRAGAMAFHLWKVAIEGVDPVTGDKVGWKDRHQAMLTILSKIEPDMKIDREALDEMDDEDAREAVASLSKLSEKEMEILQKAVQKL